MLTITEFNDSLSLALAPITLISGVGLLMICMTNRYNHATNRIRQLMAKREGNIDNSIIRSVIDTEIDLLYMRASLLRRGMLSVALSAFFSAILVAVSVSARFLDLDIHILESCILVAAVLLIVLSALLFAGEINVSLKALKLAVDKVPRHGKWSLAAIHRRYGRRSAGTTPVCSLLSISPTEINRGALPLRAANH